MHVETPEKTRFGQAGGKTESSSARPAKPAQRQTFESNALSSKVAVHVGIAWSNPNPGAVNV